MKTLRKLTRFIYVQANKAILTGLLAFNRSRLDRLCGKAATDFTEKSIRYHLFMLQTRMAYKITFMDNPKEETELANEELLYWASRIPKFADQTAWEEKFDREANQEINEKIKSHVTGEAPPHE